MSSPRSARSSRRRRCGRDKISELGDASVEVEPDGQTIALTGSAPRSWKSVVVRTGFGRDAPLRVEVIPSRHLDADRDVGFFLTAEGEAGNVVSRQRAARAGVTGEGAPFLVNDQRDEERDDLGALGAPASW